MAKQKDAVKPTFVCEDCGRSFGAAVNLGRHRKAMHPIQEAEPAKAPAKAGKGPAPRERSPDRGWGKAKEAPPLLDGSGQPPPQANPANVDMLGVVRNQQAAIQEELSQLKIREQNLASELLWLGQLESLINEKPKF